MKLRGEFSAAVAECDKVQIPVVFQTLLGEPDAEGSQEVEEVQVWLTISKTDANVLKSKLQKLGVSDIEAYTDESDDEENVCACLVIEGSPEFEDDEEPEEPGTIETQGEVVD